MLYLYLALFIFVTHNFALLGFNLFITIDILSYTHFILVIQISRPCDLINPESDQFDSMKIFHLPPK